MKIIRYKFLSAKTETEEIFIDKELRCSSDKLESNEEIAKSEAYNGKYTIEDDGVEETYQPTESERLDAIEMAMLEMMGVNVDG